MKKDIVDPVLMEPYLMLDFAKSCTDEMGESMRSMVRKAARFAVYELIMMRVKNHQKLASVRVERARGRKSQPCWTQDAMENHKQ